MELKTIFKNTNREQNVSLRGQAGGEKDSMCIRGLQNFPHVDKKMWRLTDNINIRIAMNFI